MELDPIEKKHFPNRDEFRKWAEEKAPIILASSNGTIKLPRTLPTLEAFFNEGRNWRTVRDIPYRFLLQLLTESVIPSGARTSKRILGHSTVGRTLDLP